MIVSIRDLKGTKESSMQFANSFDALVSAGKRNHRRVASHDEDDVFVENVFDLINQVSLMLMQRGEVLSCEPDRIADQIFVTDMLLRQTECLRDVFQCLP